MFFLEFEDDKYKTAFRGSCLNSNKDKGAFHIFVNEGGPFTMLQIKNYCDENKGLPKNAICVGFVIGTHELDTGELSWYELWTAAESGDGRDEYRCYAKYSNRCFEKNVAVGKTLKKKKQKIEKNDRELTKFWKE